MELLLNYMEVSPQVEAGPEAGAGSVEDEEESQCSLFCSALGDWTNGIFCPARHLTISSFRTAMRLESDSIFAAISLWGAIIALKMVAS